MKQKQKKIDISDGGCGCGIYSNKSPASAKNSGKIKVGYKNIADINTPEGRKKFLEGRKIIFSCCFCENGIEDPKNGTAIQIAGTNSTQIYWCHKECLKSKMTNWAKSEFQEV